MKIAVSVGHTLSGADTGAVGYLNESNCTREIGELVKNKLECQGHSVVYCRIDKAGSVNESLKYRVNKANAANVDLFIEIHLNAGGGHGVESWIIGTGGTAEKYAKTIANSIAELGYSNRGVKVGNLYVTRNTIAPAVLIECCFVDSKSDSDRYNAAKIANKIVKGITGVEPVEETVEYTHYAVEQVNVVDGDENITGALWKDEKFQLRWVTDDYRLYVRYWNADHTKIKEGLVEKGKENLILKIGEVPTPVQPPKEESNVLYRVQVGAFTKNENAEKLVKDLKEKGFDAYIK